MKDGLSEALYDSLKNKDVLHLQGGWQKVHPTLSFVDRHRVFFQTMMARHKMPYFHFHAFLKMCSGMMCCCHQSMRISHRLNRICTFITARYTHMPLCCTG